MAQVSEAATILFHGFDELSDQAKFVVQQGEEYPVPVYQRVVHDILCSIQACLSSYNASSSSTLEESSSLMPGSSPKTGTEITLQCATG